MDPQTLTVVSPLEQYVTLFHPSFSREYLMWKFVIYFLFTGLPCVSRSLEFTQWNTVMSRLLKMFWNLGMKWLQRVTVCTEAPAWYWKWQFTKTEISVSVRLLTWLSQLVLSTGTGVHGFTLDPSLGEFILTHPDIKVTGNQLINIFFLFLKIHYFFLWNRFQRRETYTQWMKEMLRTGMVQPQNM